MKPIQSSLRNAALALTSMFGRFGDIERTEDHKTQIVRGLHKFQEGRVSYKKRKKAVKSTKTHRRQYMSAKPLYALAKCQPTISTQIPGSRRNGRGA